MRYSNMTANATDTIRLPRNASAALLALGMAAILGCSGSDSTPAPVATSTGSVGLTTPLAFVNNRDDKTLGVVAVDGANSKVVSTLAASAFENNALGDMASSLEEWVFVNLGSGNKVATIDPLSGATPIHEANLPTGERPVHIYVDPTDKEVVWSMNDGNATTGLDSVNCSTQGGGSVTILHNSHLGPGGEPPKVQKTLCVLAAGHKVAAFSQPTASNANIPKRVFISSATAGEIAVIDNEPTSATYRTIIKRIDLCQTGKEATLTTPAVCNDESATPSTAPFTPNGSNPHGIRWSQATGKVYSLQENYDEIVEIDPVSYAVSRSLSLSGTPYTSYGITPNGRFLFLRGMDLASDPAHVTGKLAVVDLTATTLALTEVASLQDVAPSNFSFSPDGKRMFMIVANTATGASAGQSATLKKDRLLVFDPSVFPATITPLAEISVPAATGHGFGVVVKGAGAASEVVVSNGTSSTDGSVTIIDASTNQVTTTVPVGKNPGGVFVFAHDAVSNGNVASSEVATPGVAGRPERLDDHGMPE